MNINVKDIVGEGSIARISHYSAGKLYYKVENSTGEYVFPVSMLTEAHGPFFKMEHLSADTRTEQPGELKQVPYEKSLYEFASDIGVTTFEAEMKALMLMRWINVAIKKGEVAKLK